MLIQREIPWEVRSSIIFAHPEAQLVSIMPYDSDNFFAVTIDQDQAIQWWIIQQDEESTWSIEPVHLV